MCSWSAQQHTSTRGVRGLHTSLRSTTTSSHIYSGSRNVQPPPSCAVSTRRTVSETRRDRGGCGGKGSVGGVGGAGSVGVGVDCGGSNCVGGAAAAAAAEEEAAAAAEEAEEGDDGDGEETDGEMQCLLHALRATDESDHEVWYDLGARAHDLGDTREALRLYERACALNG